MKYPLILPGEEVNLERLEREHFNKLVKLARDKRIWQFYTFDGTDPERLIQVLTDGLTEREKGNQYPFVIINKKTNTIIGSTRFLDIQPQNKKLEIGATWLHPDYWGTAINLECKLLLLTYCFEELGISRVQFKTDENNIRSRKAIEKIGGKFEGVLRNDMIRDNGTKRNSAYFSIIDEEWNDVKVRLTELYRIKSLNKPANNDR